MGNCGYNPYKWSYGPLLITGDFGPTKFYVVCCNDSALERLYDDHPGVSHFHPEKLILITCGILLDIIKYHKLNKHFFTCLHQNLILA